MDGQQKFDTCKFRSAEKILVSNGGCCGKQNIENFVCFLFVDLAGGFPEICGKCVHYQCKEELKIENNG